MENYRTGVSDHSYFLDAVATVHVLTASNIDVKLEKNSTCTLCLPIKSSSRFERIKKLDRDYLFVP